MVNPVWKEKAKKLNAEADAQADSFLDKLKASKWTGAILLVAVAFVAIALFF